MITKLVLLVIGAYLLGSVPAAYLAGKWSWGIDLRQYGSGNVGASNLWRTTSKWIAMPVILFDLVKGAVMVSAAQVVGLDIAQQAAVGLAAIIGHNWPVFLRFSGGRGVLTTLGVVFILPLINNLVPWGIAGFLAVTIVGVFVFHDTALGVGAGVATLPLVSWVVDEPLSITLGFLAMFLIMVIRRLTVRRDAIAASLSYRRLLLNRLLFDRDIRDRKAWIYRTPGEASSTKK